MLCKICQAGTYFQPRNAGDDGSELASFEAYRSLDIGMHMHPEVPKAEWIELSGDDIQDVSILDCPH